MMNADELSAAVEKLQEANPMLKYDIDYMRRILGKEAPGEERRPTIVERLGHDKVWWTKFTMEFRKKTNAIMRLRKSVLPKKVQAMKKASAMSKLRKSVLPKKVQAMKKKKQTTITTPEPPPSTSEQVQEPINTPPAATEPEGTTIEEPLAAPKPGLEVIIDPSSITPKASPKPSWKINHESPAFPEPDPPLPAPGTSDTIQDTTEVQDRTRPRIERKIYRPKVKYKDVEHLLATTEGGHQLATTEGGLYRGMTDWLRGCVGTLQGIQGIQPIGLSDMLAMGLMGASYTCPTLARSLVY